MNKLVAYYRVSTRRQARSGLGLEAQQAAVLAFQARSGVEVLTSFTEVETGRRSDRPELAKAIAHAKRAGATLVVAKLDRLARNVAFTSALMESGVDFLACDNPHANRLTIHILAAVAEDEARRISERTKAALAAAKRRGVKLGAARPECRNLTNHARANGAKAAGRTVKQQADEALHRSENLSRRPTPSILLSADRRHLEPARREDTARERVERRSGQTRLSEAQYRRLKPTESTIRNSASLDPSRRAATTKSCQETDADPCRQAPPHRLQYPHAQRAR